METMIRSYKDLIVWQRASQLAVAVYELTAQFPESEKFGLYSQMQRAAVSIASNIAEGRHRSSRRDFRRFLYIAFSSGTELESQVFIAKQLKQTSACDYTKVDSLLDETMRMLNSMIQKLSTQKAKS